MYTTNRIFPANFVYILHASPKDSEAVAKFSGDRRKKDRTRLGEGPKYDPLEVKICDGKLVITIGVSLLCSAVQGSPYLAKLLQEDNVQIADEHSFAESIKQELLALESDGCNLIHRALDQAAENAVEKKCAGVEFKKMERFS